MSRNRQALILGSGPTGNLEGVIILEMRGTAAGLRAAVARTRADMERRGLAVMVEFNEQFRPVTCDNQAGGPLRATGPLH